MSTPAPAGAQRELSPAEVVGLYPAHAGTIGSFFETRMRTVPDRQVVCFDGRQWTYAQLDVARRLLARAFARRGIGKGDRIALISVNSDLGILVYLAAATLGAIFIPLNPAATREELEYLLRHAKARLVIAQPQDLERGGEIAAHLERVPELLCTRDLGGDVASIAEITAQLAALAGGPGSPEADGQASPEDAAVVIYTSGTTGFPKGVVHTHRTYILAAEGFVARMHLQPAERLLTVMPFYHINALFYSLGGAIAAGGTLITTTRFSASDFWNLVSRTGATQFNFLAAVGNILLNRPRSEFNPRHSLRKVYGGPISERMYTVFREEFHVPVLIEGYGMSEIPGACCTPYAGLHKQGSIGKAAVHPSLPGAFAELKVVDDDGKELPVGETGELVVRTPMMFKEYLDDPAQTRAAFRDGWFLTGDLVRRDADGYFYFVARKKDIIRRRGENISGAELDRILGDHPEVLEAAAIAVPSELGEDEILVVIVPRPEARPRPQDILAWCRTRLTPMKVPRYIVFADSLPHTPSHRVAKHRLKADPGLLARAFDALQAS